MTDGSTAVTQSRSRGSTALKLLTTVLFLALIALIVRNAWLSDDAYITFRTVDNLIHGYGLTWNVTERVQAYTHPLWMLFLAGVYAVTGEIYFSSLALSIAITLAAVVVLVILPGRPSVASATVLVVFVLSKAFIDYATSGLENPLTHLILALFLMTYLKQTRTPAWIARLSFLAALGMVNRLDAALLFGPALAWAWLETRDWRALGAAVLGFTPLLAWELFSLVYYGALIPNTALAKLNTGLIPQSELTQHGLVYLLNSLRVDPITLLATVVGLLMPLASRRWRRLPLALGVLLYLLYVVRVGGGFMSGRFLTAPLTLAMGLLASAPAILPSAGTHWRQTGLLVVLTIVGITAPYTPLRAPGGRRADADPEVWVLGRTIKDERANYYPNTGLWEALRTDGVFPNHDWAIQGLSAREEGHDVVVQGSVGFFGFFAGPAVTVLDILALGDPLLARLPVADPEWQIGHYGRFVPEGYVATLASGHNVIVDAHLAAYYNHLTQLTQGDLWRLDRWRTILGMHLGAYDDLIERYAYRVTDILEQDLVVSNPTDRACVYAYVWNGGAGDVYLLDDASSKGTAYALSWRIASDGVRFLGDYLRQLSSLGHLDDTELLNVGVILSPDDTLTAYEMVERRYWFRLEPATGQLRVLLPGREWRNGSAPGGYWEPTAEPVIRDRR